MTTQEPEAPQEETSEEALQTGQTIVAEFRLNENMSMSEARELIHSNTPERFSVQEIGLRENYSPNDTSV